MDEIEKKQNSWKIEEIMTDEDKTILGNLLKEHKNILVVGDRGAGKTTLLKWFVKNVSREEKLLIVDYYNEMEISSIPNQVYKAGFYNQADIVGDRKKLNPDKEMMHKALLLPFDRIIADELFIKELDHVLNQLHGFRSGIFSVSFNTPENALKHIYLQTMYPSNKELREEHLEKISKDFNYIITVNTRSLNIEKIIIENQSLYLKKIN